MRAFLDGCFLWATAFAGLLVLFGSVALAPEVGLSLGGAVTLGALLAGAAAVVGHMVHHALDRRLFGALGPRGSVADLRASDLLDSHAYSARRCAEVEEYDDEGMHYLVELDDRSLLYVTGQFLYDYEAFDDDEITQPRRFPCTEFVVHRHRTKGYVVELECRGTVLEPVVLLDSAWLPSFLRALGVSYENWSDVLPCPGPTFDEVVADAGGVAPKCER